MVVPRMSVLELHCIQDTPLYTCISPDLATGMNVSSIPPNPSCPSSAFPHTNISSSHSQGHHLWAEKRCSFVDWTHFKSNSQRDVSINYICLMMYKQVAMLSTGVYGYYRTRKHSYLLILQATIFAERGSGHTTSIELLPQQNVVYQASPWETVWLDRLGRMLLQPMGSNRLHPLLWCREIHHRV